MLVTPRRLESDATSEATRLVRSVIAAWNRADSAGLRAALHVPHVNLPGPRLCIRESEADMLRSTDFRALASVGGWHSSRLEGLDILHSTADAIQCAVTFAKSDASGRHYADGQAVHVVTSRYGRFGIQLSSVTLLPIGVGGADDAEAVASASSVLQRWVEAQDESDPMAMRRLVHLPFVEMHGPQLVVHGTATALRREVARRMASRTWHRSRLGHVRVRERSAHKVTLEAEVARLDRHGSTLGRDPTLVIVTEVRGRWALQVHSSLLTSSGEQQES
jgi:hypothetical protein